MAKHSSRDGIRPLRIVYLAAICALIVTAAALLMNGVGAGRDTVQQVSGTGNSGGDATSGSTADVDLSSDGDAATSAPCTPLSVVTAASYAPVLAAVANGLATGEDCVDVGVTIADGRTADDGLAAAGAHVWIPDDTAWAAGADPELLAPLGDTPVVVATSPIFLVGDQATAARLSAASTTGSPTWAGLAAAVEGPDPMRLVATDPASVGEGLVGVAAVTESTWQSAGMDAAAGVLASAQQLTRLARGMEVAEPAPGEIGVVSERVLLAAGRDGARQVLAPGDITAMLRYTWLPTVLDAGDAEVDAARERLLGALSGDAAADPLTAAGLRDADMTPPAGADWLPVAAAAPIPVINAHHVEHVFAAWYPADRVADVLVVVDVSGSMWARPADSDRSLITEVKEGVNAVAAQLPDSAQLGVWEFGTLLDPPRDHRVVSPPAPLTSEHRAQLASAVAAVDAQETGTGLHDTILAAYLSAQQASRPGVRSQVMVFTDGVNDADPESITMAQLGEQLSASADPARPVALGVVVFGPDELATGLGEQLGPVGGYVSAIGSAAEVTDVFAHLAAGGLHS